MKICKVWTLAFKSGQFCLILFWVGFKFKRPSIAKRLWETSLELLERSCLQLTYGSWLVKMGPNSSCLVSSNLVCFLLDSGPNALQLLLNPGKPCEACSCTSRKFSPSFDFWKLVKIGSKPPCMTAFIWTISNTVLIVFGSKWPLFVLKLWIMFLELFFNPWERIHLNLTNENWSKVDFSIHVSLVWLGLTSIDCDQIWLKMVFACFETLRHILWTLILCCSFISS